MAFGVHVTNSLAPPSQGGPTLIDTTFVAAEATQGSLVQAKVIRSLNALIGEYGPRAGDSILLYDWAEDFFREGGRQIIVGRYDGVNATYENGLALFDRDFGPGQLVVLGPAVDATVIDAMQVHCEANRRWPVFDFAFNDDYAAMGARCDLLAASGLISYGCFGGQWVDIPAPAGIIGGGTRQVPGSASFCALTARTDNEGFGSPNRAPAGRYYPLRYAIGFAIELNDVQREVLLDKGGNTYRTRFGIRQLYGFQTGIAPTPDSPFWQANCGRTRMWLQAQAEAIGENYMFKQLDGRGRLARALGSDLDVMLLGLYGADGLYGETAAEAFRTTVGASVNTQNAAALGELNATTEARLSLHTRAVNIDLVAVPITGQVSAA